MNEWEGVLDLKNHEDIQATLHPSPSVVGGVFSALIAMATAARVGSESSWVWANVGPATCVVNGTQGS